jgi:hypothetical protein
MFTWLWVLLGIAFFDCVFFIITAWFSFKMRWEPLEQGFYLMMTYFALAVASVVGYLTWLIMYYV